MNRLPARTLLACAAAFALAAPARAAFVIEVDTDGLDDGVLTFSPNFSFGGDTTTASQSSASTAVGLTGGDSIFGGNGLELLDTYQYSYMPAVVGMDADNRPLAAGTSLNTIGDVASGLTAGASGLYAVYAAWPLTTNVLGGNTLFEMAHDGGMLSISLDQNALSNQWIPLGTVELTEGNTYTLSQMAGSNAFVSMRASGVLFDRIPEPGAVGLVSAALGLLALRRRRA